MDWLWRVCTAIAKLWREVTQDSRKSACPLIKLGTTGTTAVHNEMDLVHNEMDLLPNLRDRR